MISFSRHQVTRPLFRPSWLGSARSISFSDFFGGGGGQGKPGGAPVDNEKFYKSLGIDKSATEKDVKSAYKKLALKHHPDKGGDAEKFNEISRAYEVLSDKKMRQVYDMYGEAGIDGQAGGYTDMSADAMDIFEHVFGFKREGQQPRMTNKRYKLSFSLEDLYKGATRDVSMVREVVCSACNGEGGHDVKVCEACGGQGETIRMQAMGPFYQQVVETCGKCRGQGKVIPPGKMCKPCVGKGLTKKTETVTIEVPPGTVNEREFRFEGKSDERPGALPGDLIFVVSENKHALFDRVGADLIMQKSITLQDALCGFHFRVKFLDGENLFIGSKPGAVVKPGDVWKVEGKGMRRPHGTTYGNLFVIFDIIFPESVHIGEKSRELLSELGLDRSTVLPPNDGTIEAAPLDKGELDKLREKIRRRNVGF